ncbi:CDP-alcohol phosphatidyltransferase family protein [Pseudonocardia petroleophila]|uniref:CDP-alcohol phosphatidyltransferase family protein n=1 Tax=Pseudonocardia petroleophila TaxID=37331 RepID=UPI001C8C0DE8|nr:CDP-alcohol phosphatidyltransferase family protein [Pseudonocardia petroleophila]
MLLALLTALTGLGPVGWAAGLLFAAGLWTLLDTAARRAGTDALGPADLVTLARAALVGGVLALVVDGAGPVPIVAVASVALALDAVDGRVARRTGTASALGARFDMEVDAVLLLVLSAHVAVLLGPWVLAIGLMRYAYAAAGRLLPWLRGALPVRYSAKAVAAVQGIVLVAAVAGAPGWVVAAALVLLVWSFGQSVVFLWRAR